ncbi:MAG: hypothetical protein GY940_00775 [bacterium]|nr:hypothetical protein [bacterium]
MNERKGNSFSTGLLPGLLIIAVGLIFLLERINLGEYGIYVRFRDYWPLLITIVGVWMLIQPRHSRQPVFGTALALIGVLFFANNLGYINFWFGDLWPIIIILVGIMVIKNSFWKPKVFVGVVGEKGEGEWGDVFSGGKRNVDSDYLKVSSVFGGGEYKVTSKQFKGGVADTVFGSIEVDLRDAEIKDDNVVFKANCVFGSVELRVPTHWEVVVHGSPVLASIEDKTNTPKEPGKKLIVKASSVFGSVEVKN